MSAAYRRPEDHLAAISTLLPVREIELVAPDRALGRRLARSVAAPRPLPAFDNSQMDGYALSDAHLAGGAFPVGPQIPAGADVSCLYPQGLGEPVAPIMTGAQLPDATVAVVPVEHCDPPVFSDAGTVRIPPCAPGQFLRRTGSDIPAGSMVFPAGHMVNERTVGSAALLGITELPVHRRARVVVCTGGNEVGGTGPGQIADANAPMLAAQCARYGIEVVGRVRTADDPAELSDALEQSIETLAPDAVITSGGISHGAFEVVRQVLEPRGGWFGHVAQQPGGPQGLALLDRNGRDTPVICLPGNPVSTFVSFRLFVAPLLGEVDEPMEVTAAIELGGIDGRDSFLRGIVTAEGGALSARPVGGRGSHLLAQSITANALLRVPAGQSIAPGESVIAYPV